MVDVAALHSLLRDRDHLILELRILAAPDGNRAMPKYLAVAILFSLPVVSFGQAPTDFAKRLEEADRLAWLTDWYTALPIYVDRKSVV